MYHDRPAYEYVVAFGTIREQMLQQQQHPLPPNDAEVTRTVIVERASNALPQGKILYWMYGLKVVLQ